MKQFTCLFFLSLLVGNCVYAQGNKSIYGIAFNSISSKRITMQEFEGKKVIIIEVDAANPNKNQLRELDLLVKQNKASLAAIVIPVVDFNSNEIKTETTSFYEDSLSIVVSGVSKAKKTSGSEQHVLLKWLSNKNENNHFDFEYEKAGQILVVNERGILFANLMNGADLNGILMKKILAEK